MNDTTTILMTEEQRQLIESMIDSANLMKLLNTIADIAYEKADHVRVNWQDNETARAWDHDARIIENVAKHVMC